MHFLSPVLEKYMADHSEAEPLVLQQLTRETHLKVLRPRMLTGHFQGRVLSILAKIINPATILEIGTYTGYSAICLAEGLQRGGIVHTIDINEANEVDIKMSLTAPGCPVAGEMPGWVAEAIEPLAGVKHVDVELVWEPPWGMDMMSDEARLELGFM